MEDCLSAIKIARQYDAMPILGSGISLTKLGRLKYLYDKIDVWLDSNMYHHAQKISDNIRMLGLSSRAYYTPLDPKCYSNEEIKKVLE